MTPDAHVRLRFWMSEMYAFIVVDDGAESLVAYRDRRNDTWKPMVTPDIGRLAELSGVARAIARRTGHRIRLVRFERRHDVEMFEAGN